MDPRTKYKNWPEIQEYYDQGFSVRECQKKFGFATDTWAKAVKQGKIKSRQAKPLEDFLKENVSIPSSKLKKKLLKAKVFENKCFECGQLPIWNNKPLVLELDHINGNKFDNRIENLRILCGHCHSQTPTFCRGQGKYK